VRITHFVVRFFLSDFCATNIIILRDSYIRHAWKAVKTLKCFFSAVFIFVKQSWVRFGQTTVKLYLRDHLPHYHSSFMSSGLEASSLSFFMQQHFSNVRKNILHCSRLSYIFSTFLTIAYTQVWINFRLIIERQAFICLTLFAKQYL
jgi:hypothetical protein